MSVVFLYVLYDIYTRTSVVMELRRILRAQGPMGVIADTMSGVMGSPENYIKMMNTHDEFVDHLFIQMTASILGQDIILLHVHNQCFNHVYNESFPSNFQTVGGRSRVQGRGQGRGRPPKNRGRGRGARGCQV